MPRKKGTKKSTSGVSDVTIYDFANTAKPVTRLKKSPEVATTLAWDEIPENGFDWVQQVNTDGTKSLVFKKKEIVKSEKSFDQNDTGGEYPEILWYLISRFIRPEDVASFACINKATYTMTKREYFWRHLYKRYCQGHPRLPTKLEVEKNCIPYGLKMKVVRALYYTYKLFVNRVQLEARQPHLLIKRKCVNVWFNKGPMYWSVYFKLKKVILRERIETGRNDYMDLLGKIDANPDEGAQVLVVSCQSFLDIPPLMGMTLTSVSLVLSEGFTSHQLQLGFNSGFVNTTSKVIPEVYVMLNTVANVYVYDWWHPRYPYSESLLPSYPVDEETIPILKREFFDFQN